MRRYLWAGLWAVGALAVHARPVNAQVAGGGDGLDRNCLNAIGNVQIGGNLMIAARCELDGTDVRGNVTLFAGGSLAARNVRIRGNLTGSRANFVELERSRVDGNVTLEELVGDESAFLQTEVRGNVELNRNRSKLELLNNDLRGDLIVSSNTGGVLISGNAIDDDLRCTSNQPAPVGIGNRVDGRATGQCQNLQPEAPTPTPTPTPSPTPTPTPAPTPTPTPSPAPAPEPPPASSPPPAAAPPADEFVDEGGAGATGWFALLLLPLVAWRRGYLRSAQRDGAARRYESSTRS